jgi:hypothetical protein
MSDFYHLLSVERSASQEEIQHRYRYLVTVYHPDRFSHPEHKRQAEEDMKRINQAYAVLSNPEARARYDRGELLMEESRPTGGVKTTSRARREYQRAQGPKAKPTPSDSVLGVGAVLILATNFGVLFWLVSVIGMTPLRLLLVILLTFIFAMPMIFKLDDTLRRKKK